MPEELLTTLEELRETIAESENSYSNKNRQPKSNKSEFGLIKADYSKIKINNYVEKAHNKILSLKNNIEKHNPDNKLILEMLSFSHNTGDIIENLPRLIELAGN